ncbi:hypothetical protein [Oculatella sp. LEGE 06141]|nr:hypothetical protein [Oculatella sp. LEGE 06141]
MLKVKIYLSFLDQAKMAQQQQKDGCLQHRQAHAKPRTPNKMDY